MELPLFFSAKDCGIPLIPDHAILDNPTYSTLYNATISLTCNAGHYFAANGETRSIFQCSDDDPLTCDAHWVLDDCQGTL